ncbi:MAG: hypothetical protein M3P37_03955 [Actinomycetota bacterium]|nr:hypothetical protein [Actinomycetota bacterium]
MVRWISSIPAEDLYLSVLVIGEVRYGAERSRRRDPQQAGVYQTWFEAVARDCADPHPPRGRRNRRGMGRTRLPEPLSIV